MRTISVDHEGKTNHEKSAGSHIKVCFDEISIFHVVGSTLNVTKLILIIN